MLYFGTEMMTNSIASVLATKRLVRLLVHDTIMEPVRERVWDVDPPSKHRIGYVLTCDSCSSVWSAAVVFALGRSSIGQVICNTLAVSEAALLLTEALEQVRRPDSPDFEFSS